MLTPFNNPPTQNSKSSARRELERKRGFLTSSEWADVDNTLSDLGVYAQPAFSRAVRGDTGLTLSVRLGQLKVVIAFLAVEECDPTIPNDEVRYLLQ